MGSVGKSSNPVVGYRYYLGLHMAVCYGPVDQLQTIWVNKQQVWPGTYPDGIGGWIGGAPAGLIPPTASPVTASMTDFYIKAPGIFGGITSEGGIQGYADVCMGESSQLEDVYLRSVLPGVGSTAGFTTVNYYGAIPPWTEDSGTTINGATWIVPGAEGPAATGLINNANAPGYIPGSLSSLTALSLYAGQIAIWDASVAGISTYSAGGAWRFFAPTDGEQVSIGGGKLYLQYTLATNTWAPIIGAGIPAFRGLFTFVCKQMYLAAHNPYIKPWSFRVKRILAGWYGNAPYNSAQAECPSGSGDMNPAHIIYQCLTDPQWGRGISASLIDLTSFNYAANYLYTTDQLGLSIKWDQTGNIDDFINVILQHIDGVVYQDLQTNLWNLKLIRNDYTVATLPIFDETNIIKVETCKRPTPGDLTNSIVVTYHDRVLRKDTTITLQNIAALQSNNGQVNQQSVDRHGISNQPLAQRIGMRDLTSLSIPLLRANIHCNRQAMSLRLGSVFKFQYPEYGIGTVIMRVADINYGKLDSGAIIVSCVEDVFSMPSSTYLGAVTSQWVSPNSTPVPALYPYFGEAPYYALVNYVYGETASSLITATQGLAAITGVKPVQDATAEGVQLGASGAEVTVGTGPFCPECRIPLGGAQENTSTVLFDQGVDMAYVVVGDYAAWENEMVGVSSINTVSGTLVLNRGVLDTVPVAHAPNTRIQFIEGHQFISTTQYALGTTLYGKLLPKTAAGSLDPASAPELSYTFNERQIRPYPPGNLKIDGNYYPTIDTETGSITITWAHRDRTQQTVSLTPQTSGNIGPEAGVTYNLTVTNADTSSVIATYTGLSGTSQVVTVPGGAFNCNIQLWSVRGGISSWQTWNYTFLCTSPNTPLPGAGHLQITGYAPLAKIYYGTYSPPAGSLSLTGRAPTIVYGISYPPSGSVAITGYPPVSGIGGYWITEEDLVTIITDESGNLLVTE